MHSLENTLATRIPWNKGKLVGQKPPLKFREIWAIRIRLQLAQCTRDLALFEQNVRLALSMADRGYVLESGRMAVSGKSKSLMNHKTVRRVFLGG